ncbi:MAG: hypothetical protein K2L44_10675 [Duncaniella sp.]|nr:hypothetical protein [Duncaniella sp.]
MKRLILTLLSVVTLTMAAQSQQTRVKQPDFSYPKTVSANSIKNLDTALDEGNTPKAMRALIDYTLAEQMIGRVNLPMVFSRIDSVKSVSKSEILTSLTNLLEASIYNGIYSSNRWKYDKRDVPLTPLPEDFNEWSGAQYRMKIESLLDSALTPVSALKSERLQAYKVIISQDVHTAIYYPTLYDFAANKAISIIESMGRNVNGLIPLKYLLSALSPGNSYVPPTLYGDPLGEKVLALYTSLISPTSPYSAPSVNAMLGRMRFMLNNTPEITDCHISPYLRLYKNLCDNDGAPITEYAADVLIEAPRDTAIYRYAKEYLTKYPNYWRVNCVKNIVASIEAKNMTVSTPTLVPIGREVEIDITVNNVTAGAVAIYDVSSLPVYNDAVDVRTRQSVPGKKIATIPFSVAESVPFSQTVKLSYIFPHTGNYIAVPEIEGVSLGMNTFSKIHASSVVLVPSRFIMHGIEAMNPEDGAPIEGVRLTLVEDPYNATPHTVDLGKTDAEGHLKIKEKKNGMVIATLGADKYTEPVYTYNYNYTRPNKWTPGTEGYSSLPLYHLGDTARWVAVCYEYKGGLRRVVAGKEIQAVLHDANSMPIDTVTGVTDRFGRLTGEFVLPSDGLSGRFNIAVAGDWNAISFEVSDYKLPTFSITAEKAEQGTPSAGDVTLRGKVATYSGFPMADTEITLKLSVENRPIWWRASSPYCFYSLTTKTDANGQFSIPLTKDILDMSPIKRGFYTAEYTATSATGESQTSSTVFTLGERYIINVQNENNINIANVPVNLNAKVTDYMDSTVTLPINLTIYKDGKTIRSEVLRNPVDLSGLTPGKYTLAYSLDKPELADSVRCECVLYDPSAKITPVSGTLFWSPTTNITVENGNTAELLYATDADSHLIVAATSGDTLLSKRIVKAPVGMNKLNVELPEGFDEAKLNILCTGDYRQHSQTFNVVRAASRKGIRFVTETFRDKLMPGENETWTFRIETLDGSGKEAAVITDLYNTALDALAKSEWGFNIPSVYTPSWNWVTTPLTQKCFSSLYQNAKHLRCPSAKRADFATYGKSLTPSEYGGGLRIRGVSAMAQKTTNTINLVREHKEEASVEEVAADYDMADSGAAMYASGSVEDSRNQEPDNSDKFTYRQSEVPIAFFRPSLVTDKDGHLTLTFTVPNANTTWGFRAIAFTDSLLNTGFSANVTASKPLMVQPNLPRFIRVGDKAVISASVMNNSGSEKSVNTTVEIFDPVSGANILALSQPDTIPSGKSAIVTVEVNVPSDKPFIGYRVKSEAGDNADGEQSLIPILSTVSPVIETAPFYMSPDDNVYETLLPNLPEGSTLTLSFCENPAWYVVTALPGLIDKKADTAPSAALSIYSAAVAAGLVKDNPSIAEAMKEWQNSDRRSETLTSMLNRNNELKTVLLNATPWMTEASDDTERMTRLALLFDKELVESTLQQNIATLKSLEDPNGGWYWCKQYPHTSNWSTRSVLSLLGQLNTLGYLPDNRQLKSMIEKALGRDTRETVKEFSKYPNLDYTEYVRLHDLFNSLGSDKPDRRIVERTIQTILKDWKNYNLMSKATAASILYKHNYPSVAKQILASIREYATIDKTKGMWFPSLDDTWLNGLDKVGITAEILMVFHHIEPDCADIDLLRQWLILQKGAQNWGSGRIATTAVAAILSTSGRWFIPAKGAKISIDGKTVKPSESEKITGELKTVIPAKEYGGKLKISRKGDTPSWGTLFSQYSAEMTDVKSASCPELSIEKALYLSGNTADSEQATSLLSARDARPLGAKVIVTLTVTVNADMDYVVITDDRPACFEPVEQLPQPVYSEGICFYRENRDASTRIFIDHLPKGTYVLSYEMWANNAGTYTSGIATAQSEYAPRFTAHSGGRSVMVK